MPSGSLIQRNSAEKFIHAPQIFSGSHSNWVVIDLQIVESLIHTKTPLLPASPDEGTKAQNLFRHTCLLYFKWVAMI